MNQPQPLCVSLDFQGYLVCQIPKDALEVSSKSKPSGVSSPYTQISSPGQKKYGAWRKASRHKIHLRRRQHHMGDSHLNVSWDSGTFINSGQGLGFPLKFFIDSDTDQEFPPHIPILEDYCRTCLTEKVRCSCQPMSDWSGKLIDITQLDPPSIDTNKDRDDIQDQALPSDWTDQDNFWLGKTYDKARAQSLLKPAPPNPPSKTDEESEWSEHLHPHNYRAKAPLQVSPSKPPPGWPKGIRS